MAAVETRVVRWPAKFGQRTVIINAADFDPAVHRDPSALPDPVPVEPVKPVKVGRGFKGGE